MTKEQAIDFLHFTKVRLRDINQSNAVQRKAFEIGYKWFSGASEPTNLDYPFIAFDKDKGMFCEWCMSRYELADEWCGKKEITAEEILAITIEDEPKYRPFKDSDECWEEMQKHKPFGWLKHKLTGGYLLATHAWLTLTVSTLSVSFEEAFRLHTFADGAPFGIKEE